MGLFNQDDIFKLNDVAEETGDREAVMEYIGNLYAERQLRLEFDKLITELGLSGFPHALNLLNQTKNSRVEALMKCAGASEIQEQCPDIGNSAEFLAEFWHAVRTTCNKKEMVELLGECNSLSEAFRLIRETQPNLSLIYDSWDDGVPMEDLVA